MNLRRTLFLLLIVALIWLFRPAGTWNELQRIWERRELVLRALVFIILVYFLYGLYSLYEQGRLAWLLP
jgi:cadmium resistance protein CadD (predicted permease)